MIVSGKEGLGSSIMMNMLDNSLSQRHPIVSRRPAPQLIKENERTLAGLPNGPIGLHHLHHKGGLAGHQIIRRTDASENRIKYWQTGRPSGHIRAHLCHNNDDSQLAHIS